jgi:signal recognition particle receptor subunit beta
MGVVLLVDSTDPKSFERVTEIQKIACGKTTPYIVAANKQDLKDAMEPEQVRKKLALPSKVPIVAISALDPAGVMESLEEIVRKIVEAR